MNLDGTIFAGDGWPDPKGVLVPTVTGATVRVDFSGEIVYAAIGEEPERLWWFAGIGGVEEVAP